MKKRIWLIFGILLTLGVSALTPIVSEHIKEEPLPPTVRYTNFETDNVHILRLQNFTRAVVTEVDGLRNEFDDMHVQFARIQMQLEELQRATRKTPSANYDTQLSALSTQLTNLQRDVRSARSIQSHVVKDVPQASGESLASIAFVLLILFVCGGLLMLFLQRRTPAIDVKKYAEVHAQLHMTNYLRHAIDRGENIARLRKHFSNQGWTQEQFDTALDEVLKK